MRRCRLAACAAFPTHQSRFLVLLAVAGAVAMGAGMFAKGVLTVRKAWMVRARSRVRCWRAAHGATATG
jgi:hypothetical protein